MKKPPTILRCKILLTNGEPCNKPLGQCIHWYIPTKFGRQP